MPEPFVFHFKPGSSGRPETLYMLDLDCECAVCGHVQFQRFYHSTPFHELTLVELERRADEAALKAGYECENCGEPVGADQVRNTVLAYGFADDAGVIRIFDDLRDDSREYELTPMRRLDPQVVPRWSAEPGAFGKDHRVEDHLDETVVEEILGRPFNIKLAWRDFLDEQLDESGERWTRISGDLWAFAADEEHDPEFIAGDIDDETFAEKHRTDELVEISLSDSAPRRLPTHDRGEKLHARWSSWLSDPVADAVDSGRLDVRAFVAKTPAVDAIERTFEVGRLEFHKSGDGEVFSKITTPTGIVYERDAELRSVLRRAVYTGLTPGEAGRLTAEEIVGVLMQVF